MKYPKFIKKGDTIAFIAPSFGAATEPYQKQVIYAKRRFNKMGYEVIYGKNAFLEELPYLSNTPELVAEEFNENYLDTNSQALISVGGGEMEILGIPFVDFEKIKEAEPKWFMGFSDNTNHCFLLLTLADTASIYGNCAGAFSMYNWDQSIKDCYELLTGEKLVLKGYPKFQLRHSAYQKKHPMAPYNLKEPKILQTYPKANVKFSGRLIGGCLDILILLCGTKYDNVKNFIEKYKDDGFIWFLEACDLGVLSIKRALFQLKEAGWFKYAKGFLIGRPQAGFYEDFFGVNRFNVIEELKELDVPIVLDFDLGHIKPSMPMMLGACATVSVKENDVKVKLELK